MEEGDVVKEKVVEVKEKKKVNYSKQGKLNRAAGQRFEAKVRQHLEEMGWIVAKCINTIDYSKNKIVPAKRKYNPFKKVMVLGTGFPDFICFKRLEGSEGENYDIIGLEVKSNGYLDKVEKDMCKWLLDNKIFSKILIAKAVRNGRKIEAEYIDFLKKYNEGQ
jgi:predicted Holliday junction resolvase-like endonuclease